MKKKRTVSSDADEQEGKTAESSANSTPVRGRPFQKGRSGNPGGRPRSLAQVQRAARRHAVDAVETLASIMRTSRSPKARIAAAQALLDRGYGKPAQAVAVATLDLPKPPNFGISFAGGGPGCDPDTPLLAAPPASAPAALPAPERTDPSHVAAAPSTAPSCSEDAPERAGRHEPVVVDAATDQVAPLRMFEQLGRPQPPDPFAETRLREAGASRRRQQFEENLEEQNRRAREQQQIRAQKLREQGWD